MKLHRFMRIVVRSNIEEIEFSRIHIRNVIIRREIDFAPNEFSNTFFKIIVPNKLKESYKNELTIVISLLKSTLKSKF